VVSNHVKSRQSKTKPQEPSEVMNLICFFCFQIVYCFLFLPFLQQSHLRSCQPDRISSTLQAGASVNFQPKKFTFLLQVSLLGLGSVGMMGFNLKKICHF